MTEQFYRDLAALQQAGTVCVENRVSGLDSWVIDQLAIQGGANVLHIGCENDEQTLSLARAIGQEGYVLAIDRSYRTLNALSQHSQAAGLQERIRFLYLNLDDLAGHVHDGDFDSAVSARALYHIKQPQAVFQAIRQALKPGGVFFFYGPARNDLAEFRLFNAALRDEVRESRELLFVEKIGLPHAREAFSQVEIARFENPLCFDSPDALYVYWRESDFYEESLDRDFRHAVVQHFQTHTSFETAQRLIGVRAVNS